jgi:hypothetical protein
MNNKKWYCQECNTWQKEMLEVYLPVMADTFTLSNNDIVLVSKTEDRDNTEVIHYSCPNCDEVVAYRLDKALELFK